jgi:acyl carrier protein
MEAEGVASFTTAQGLAMFGHLLATAPAQAIVMPVNWERFRASHVVTADPRLFASLTTSQRTDGEGSRGAADFRTELERTEPERRREFFEHALIADLAQVLRLPASRIDPQRPLGQLGLESLMALEFRNRLEARLGLKISATVVWNHPTIHALARHLASRIGISLDAVDEASETAAATAASSDIGSLDEMSEEEALRALSGAEPGTR